MKETELVRCSRCGRDVRIVLSDGGHREDGQANIPDTRYVCLDFDDGCEAGGGGEPEGEALCPVFGVTPAVMGIERARAGLTPEPRLLLGRKCEGCGGETTQERVGGGYAVCVICGSTNVLDPGAG